MTTNLNFKELFNSQKRRSFELRKSTAQDRIQKLNQILLMLKKFESQILEATYQDFGKPEVETTLSELLLVVHEARTAIKNLNIWMSPRSVSSGLLLLGSKSEIHYEPRGVCLIISPWNYPWQLSLSPLVAAIAAGNTVILKPSELTPKCSELLEKMLDETFAKNEVAVFLGDQAVSTALLELPFDHIFFTGSTAVGKIVMRAASQNLTSVTLELGGKSPLIVDETADLTWTAERLLWGKWINAGQSCVAPDTVFVDRKIWPRLQDEIKKAGLKMCKNWKNDFSQIISPRHFDRLQKMAENSQGWKLAVEVGEAASASQRRLPIQFFEEQDRQKTNETLLHREEIFGPLTAVILYAKISEALEQIAQMDKPLSLYLFSNCKKTWQQVAKETSSGSLVFNDVLVQLTNPSLPFGGVGPSGIGSYHGEYGFRTFSHEKAVLWQGGAKAVARFFAPPYSLAKLSWAKRVLQFFS